MSRSSTIRSTFALRPTGLRDTRSLLVPSHVAGLAPACRPAPRMRHRASPEQRRSGRAQRDQPPYPTPPDGPEPAHPVSGPGLKPTPAGASASRLGPLRGRRLRNDLLPHGDRHRRRGCARRAGWARTAAVKRRAAPPRPTPQRPSRRSTRPRSRRRHRGALRGRDVHGVVRHRAVRRHGGHRGHPRRGRGERRPGGLARSGGCREPAGPRARRYRVGASTGRSVAMRAEMPSASRTGGPCSTVWPGTRGHER